MTKKYTVLVTSAVYSNYGIYNPQERIAQTLETVKSARSHIPNATIILIDNSKVDVQQDDSAELNELIDAVDYYIDNSGDPDIQHFHEKVTNYDIGKNCMESIGMLKALSYIMGDENIMTDLTDSSRVFKLSGRYVIDDRFDLSKFDNEATNDKWIFKKAQFSWIPEADTGVNRLLQTRLWAFSPSQLTDTVSLFQVIINNMFDLLNRQKYIDVEHSMAKFIPADRLVELDEVGVSGNIAPNGAKVQD